MKYIKIVFVMFLMGTMLSIGVLAESVTGKCGENAIWEYDTATKTLTISGKGDIDDIQYEYNEKYSTGYVQPWIEYSQQIETVIISEGIHSIGSYAFSNHFSLKKIELPKSLFVINDFAFYQSGKKIDSIYIPSEVLAISPSCFHRTDLCSITVDENNDFYKSVDGVLYDKEMSKLIHYPSCKNSVSYTLPNSVTEICEYAFTGNSSLRKINLPESLEYIGYDAFFNLYMLEEITIPAKTWYIDEGNFNFCDNLKVINVAKDNQSYSSEDGVLFDKEKTKLIIFPSRKNIDEYIVPETVIRIMPAAFYLSKIGNITLPSNLMEIGYDAFLSCHNLETIYIPESVEVLEWSVFYDCMNLKELYFLGDLPFGDNPEYYDYEEDIPPLCVEDIVYSDYGEINIYYLYNKKGWNALDKAYLKDLEINLIPFSLSEAEAEESETEKEPLNTVESTDTTEEGFAEVDEETPETILDKDMEEETSLQVNFIETAKTYIPYVIIVIIVATVVVIIIVVVKKRPVSKKANTKVSRICSKCGFIYDDDLDFCAKCGTPYTIPKEVKGNSTCPECGFELEEGTLFCGNCGRKIT